MVARPNEPDAAGEPARPQTVVTARFTVRNPRVETLQVLLKFLIANRAFDPAEMARSVMSYRDQPVDHQIGPGLRAITCYRGDPDVIQLRWDHVIIGF